MRHKYLIGEVPGSEHNSDSEQIDPEIIRAEYKVRDPSRDDRSKLPGTKIVVT